MTHQKLYVGTVILHLVPQKNVIFCVTSKQIKHESNVAAAKKSTKLTQFFSKAKETGMHFSKQVATAE